MRLSSENTFYALSQFVIFCDLRRFSDGWFVYINQAMLPRNTKRCICIRQSAHGNNKNPSVPPWLQLCARKIEKKTLRNTRTRSMSKNTRVPGPVCTLWSHPQTTSLSKYTYICMYKILFMSPPFSAREPVE